MEGHFDKNGFHPLTEEIAETTLAVLPAKQDEESFDWSVTSWQMWLAMVSVGFSFSFAAISGFPDSLALGVFFALASDFANTLFQADQFYKMSKKSEALPLHEMGADRVIDETVPLLPVARGLHFPAISGSLICKCLGMIPSLIGNAPLAVVASIGIDACTSDPSLGLWLKLMSIIGVVSESVISVRGASGLMGVLKDLWGQRAEHPIAFALALLLGNVTAIGFSLNGVGAIQQALKRYLPGEMHETIDSPYAYGALWIPNLYPLAFGCTYGMDGFFAIFSKILPGLKNGSTEEKLGYLIALSIAVSSIGPSVGVALASGIDGGVLSIFSMIGIGSCIGTNLAPLTISAGLKIAEKILACCGCVKKTNSFVFGSSATNSDSPQISPEFGGV